MDVISAIGSVASQCIWDPRKYWLLVAKMRIKAVVREWQLLIDHIAKAKVPYYLRREIENNLLITLGAWKPVISKIDSLYNHSCTHSPYAFEKGPNPVFFGHLRHSDTATVDTRWRHVPVDKGYMVRNDQSSEMINQCIGQLADIWSRWFGGSGDVHDDDDDNYNDDCNDYEDYDDDNLNDNTYREDDEDLRSEQDNVYAKQDPMEDVNGRQNKEDPVKSIELPLATSPEPSLVSVCSYCGRCFATRGQKK
jgi:hypothetical protein